MLKKTAIILVVLIAIFLIGWFLKEVEIKNLLKSKKVIINQERKKPSSKTEKSTIENQPQDEVIAKGKIKMAKLNKDKKIIYYNQNNVLEVDLTGQHQKNLTSQPFGNPEAINCSQRATACLAKNNNQFSVYNLKDGKKTSLRKAIEAIDFNSQEDGLVYFFEENNYYNLSTSNLNGKNWISVDKIKAENLEMAVNVNNQVAYYSQGADQEASGIFLTSLVGKNKKQKLVNKDILDILWSPKGKKLLFSYYDHSVTPKRVQLGYYDLEQKEEYKLGLPGIAKKCVWSEDSNFLYCATLTSSEKKEFSLEKWYSKEFVSRDIFWKIDLVNFKKEKLFNDLEKYPVVDAFDLILSENNLYFVNKLSGNLVKREL